MSPLPTRALPSDGTRAPRKTRPKRPPARPAVRYAALDEGNWAAESSAALPESRRAISACAAAGTAVLLLLLAASQLEPQAQPETLSLSSPPPLPPSPSPSPPPPASPSGPIDPLDKPLAQACDTQWVFVFCTGHSGSTTILQLLNSVTGISLSGENGQLLGLLAAAVSMTDHASWMGTGAEAWHQAWANSPNARETHGLVCMWLRNLVRDRPPALIHGFKEIRFPPVERLLSLFPSAKVIVNFRRDLSTPVMEGGSNRSGRIAFAKSRQGNIDSAGMRLQTHDNPDLHMPVSHDGAWTWFSEGVVGSQSEAIEWADRMPQAQVFRLPLEDFSLGTFNRLLRWLGVRNCSVAALPTSKCYSCRPQRPTSMARLVGSCAVSAARPAAVPSANKG